MFRKLTLISIIVLAAILRFYKLSEVPPSLNWDETSLGYNAFSIFKTQHDEHGRFFPLTNFAAFGDYKPPGYIYAAVPSVAAFGLNEFSVRFPSAFVGVLTIVLTYLLAKKLFQNESIAQTTGFFLAISPWHLQFSRGAFEGNLGLFFSLSGIYLFIKFAKDNVFYILPAALSFLAAMYTFTGQRLFVPLILPLLAILFRNEILKNLKVILLTVIFSLILIWPLFRFATQTLEGRSRFDEVTIFKNLEPIDDSIRYRSQDNFLWWANIIHNRRFFFAHEYLIHYFDAFNPSFLFTRGDVNPRLSIQEVGELHYFDIPLILAGLYYLFAKKEKYRYLIIGWLLISPLGPAAARETPHALRMIHILPTFQLIGAYGLYSLYQIVRFKKSFIFISTIIIVASLLYYLHMYYVHWPKEYSGQWQFGYKQAVMTAKSHYQEVDNIVVAKKLGRPYIFFLFHTKYNPKDFWEKAKITKDQLFLYEVNQFDKFYFTDNPGELDIKGRTLYIVGTGQMPRDAQPIDSIKDLSANTVFEVGIK